MTNSLPEPSQIKLIATDLDGTLLNKKGQVSERTKTIIKKILKKYPDLHFVIATGRTRPSTIHVREALGIMDRPNTESLQSNGCVVYDSKGEIIWQNLLPIEYVLKFHEFIKAYPQAVYFYASGDDIISFEDKFFKRPHLGSKKPNSGYKKNPQVYNKEEYIKRVELGESKINKVSLFVHVSPETEEMRQKLQELGKEYNLECCHSMPWFIEYMPYNTNKGTGLTELIKSLNIDKDEVIAFGDGGNDLELFQSVGWPVAMENACNELKLYARLTTKSNVEDGVADMLEKIFLKDDLAN
ncbi:hypothetical protein BCR32DRAFT_326930 [Anaeromyces robustus]|uniref:HAD-like protein n=1 Tax=Anaeromyces robustus TaxID=1754192 RepID=A0A1Y1X972_9FUNG|nr:hypothetical protein BCR32DRAFT_326930 [Anaeromyces robustus]|eukprot:ORX82268.1 hypothetical protein BCR32DRAFT_326930 [Anaeromyces robustus]